ncbi:pyrimidine-nucleoside phosphorylase [Geobacillus stearothermophilus]|uniref:pyrimidine-nucleoside phosphorylase n=1 Tax=Geobacillus stearothermophilus TaxID=1422 RepID=UPI000EF53E66|nr:pyrimidine-nucleoside phosphorylase [Geobacillus stearothermophilus]MED3732183.1 pyrimidine-nucleoside phosphorylase [Geobacillus stearothermophilus]MED3734976.1 pyrimidine-nucleoside phosphorylase [Geobacillus stearothermophilus]MED3741889.1 pyrimidine-nucleoside phosphorylase [Geobacillus stearothermophilus]MED3749888.1 pyrimidine-nucleoside phosphorylase [Geobacillus stearothermophilus]MED3756550.1 pyrimidine-nucleoside phosphorylase [Geobacillus stearothermophilus]
MRMVDLIAKKRDGKALTKEEIEWIVRGYTNGDIPDYQMSALAMAIYFRGMTEEETAALTMAMVQSGEMLDLSSIRGVKVDKHSTGGVGDTTTLVLGPLVASVGVPVAKMSGRGLGHTGGTIDKLESVPGFHVEISKDEFIRLVNENGIAIIGQTGDLTPADKKLYALRDVTATVNSIPLIASSIMSKKIAAGADAIVLDVKTGAGAFMKKLDEARRLARVMVDIGKRVGRRTMAVISDMSQPLGYAVGNALEVKEAIETLKGNGPHDLTELCLTLGSPMVYLAEKAPSLDEARRLLEEAIRSGAAIAAFKTFLAAQGGDASVVDDLDKLPKAAYTSTVTAAADGYVAEMAADDIGTAAMWLGAGRAKKEDVIDLAVGIVLHKKIGDRVQKGEALATIHSNRPDVLDVKEKIEAAIRLSPQPVARPPLIYETIV